MRNDMQLTCPNCGEPISTHNINIQELVAACPACNTVFEFKPPQSKSKRRKVKQPEKLTLEESDQHLHMVFRTNFRLDRNQAFLISVILSLLLTSMALNFMEEYPTGKISVLLPIGFALGVLLLVYRIALIVYNQTHIEVDDERIKVSRQPLPGVFQQSNDIDLSGIVSIRYEETPISIKEGYDTPRYRVWAEMADGRRKTIVNDVIDDYAPFIAQGLNEHLQLDTPPETARLTDEDQESENDLTLDAYRLASQLDEH